MLDSLDVAVLVHEAQQLAKEVRETVGKPVHGAEIQNTEPAIVHEPEVSWMWVGVQQTRPCGPGEEEPDKKDAGPVPVLGASLGNDLGEWGAADPLGDQDVVGGQDDARDQELGVAGIGVRERILGDRLELVVEFFGDPLA